MKKPINQLKKTLALASLAFAMGTASNVYAEYYIVYSVPECYVAYRCCHCYDCCNYHYMRFVSPRRHAHRGSEQTAEYAWESPDP